MVLLSLPPILCKMRTLFKSLSLLLLGSFAGSALTAQTTATGPGFLDSWTWQAPAPVNAQHFLAVAANGDTVIAVGQSGRVHRSTDGGDTWEQVVSPQLGASSFSGIANNGATFVTVGSGGVARVSTDNGVSWAIMDVGTSEDLLDIAFANNRWVVVGDKGTIRRSSDGGATWSEVSNSSERPLNAVAFFNNRFYAGGDVGTLVRFTPDAASADLIQGGIGTGGFTYDIRDFGVGAGQILAVGTNGDILRSTNGINWAVVFSNSAYNFNTVSFHPAGFFLAAGHDGRYVYSLNGVNWTEGTSRTPFAVNGLIPRDDDFLAVGSRFTVVSAAPIMVSDALISMLGIEWTILSASDDYSFRGAAFGDGAFVVVGDSGEIRFSLDGSTWSEPANPPPAGSNWQGVAFGDGRFVAVGEGNAVAFAEADDLDNWTDGSVAGGPFDFSSVAFGNNRFVATARNSSVLVSDDGGATWNAVLAGSVASNELASVAFGNGRFVAVGLGGTIFTSNNAFTWTPRFTPVDTDLTGVIYGPQGFVVVGAGGTVLTSEFGATWTRQSSGTELDLEAIAFAGGIYLATGASRSILTSIDTREWALQGSLTQNRFLAAAAGGGMFVVAGEFGSILSSSSPLSSGLDRWTLRNPAALSDDLSDVLFANGLYILTGANGRILTSVDGENWTPRNSGTTENITGIAYGNDRWVAVAGQDILVSTDGINWNVTTTWTFPMFRIAFAEGRFVAVGDASNIFSSVDGLVWSGGVWHDLPDRAPMRGISYSPEFGVWIAVGDNLPELRAFVSEDDNGNGNGDGDNDEDPPVAAGRPVQLYVSFDGGVSFQFLGLDLLGQGINVGITDLSLRTVVVDTVNFGGPRLVAVGDSNLVSADGLNWSAMGGSPFALDAAFGDANGFANFVIVGEGGSIFSFSNQEFSFPGITEDINAVTYANDRFIAVGSGGRILTSPEGRFWQVRSVEEQPALRSIARGAAAYVAVGEDGRIFRSASGVDWTPQPPPPGVGSPTMRSVIWTGSSFLAVGDVGTIWTSPNGTTWSQRFSGVVGRLNAAASSPSATIAVGNDGRILWEGAGPESEWSARTSGTSQDLLGAIWDAVNEQFIVVGANGLILTSPNGISWSPATDSPLDSLPLRDLAQSTQGHILAIGDEGRIFASVDGETWDPLVSGTRETLRSITYGDGIFLALGDNGVALSSSDLGNTWFSRPTNTAYTLFGSTYFEEVFFAVGGVGTIIHSGVIFDKEPQFILFPTIGEQILPPTPLVLEAVASSGLPVLFEVMSGPAEISGNELTLTGVGTVTVRAVQLGNRFFGAAESVSHTFDVVVSPREAQTIEVVAPIIDQSFGRTIDLSGFFRVEPPRPDAPSLVFEVVSGPATLSGSELTTGLVPGLVTIRVTLEGDAGFKAAEPKEVQFQVRDKLPQHVSIIPPQPLPVLGDPAITLNASSSSGLDDFSFRVISGPAHVTGKDQLAVYGVGVVTLEVKEPGDSEFDEATARISFSVGGSDNFEPGPGFLDLWTWQSPVLNQNEAYRAIAHSDEWIVAVGNDGRIARRESGGGNWETVASVTTAHLRDVIYVPGRFIVVGDAGTLLLSQDMGETWQEVDVPGTPDLRGIAARADGNLFAAVGAEGIVLTSTNAESWTDASPAGFSRDLAAVTWDPRGNRFFAVGSTGAILRSTGATGTQFQVIREGLGFGLHAIHAPEHSFGDWRLFAVGDNGIVLGSKDGLVWSNRFSGSAYSLNAVHSGNGFLVAAGEDGRVLYSRNGDVWTESFTRFDVSIFALSFHRGLFFAGGDNFSIFTSPQGLTWTIEESTDRVTLRASASNPDGSIRVAVGDNGRILRSLDGINWAPAGSVPSAENLRGVTFGSNRFTAVGAAGVILSSPNGDVWTVATSNTTSQLNDVAFANDLFVAVGNDFNTLISTDGLNWNRVTSGAFSNLNAVAYGNGLWTIIGDNGVIVTSIDGNSWETQFSGTTSDLRGLTFGNNQFVAVGEKGTVFTSPFGDVWTLRASGTTFDLEGVAVADGVYVAVGEGFTFLTSRNGVDWSAQKSGTRNSLRHVSYAADLFVAVGDFGTILTATGILPPGLDRWTLRNPLPSGPALREVIYANGIYMAVGDGGTILASTDGLNWTTRDSGVDEPITGIAYGNGRFVAVGGQNILVSEDTLEWTVQTTWLVPLYTVTFGANIFVAVGAESHILHSADGIIWAGGSRSLDGQDINDVHFSNGRFVAVGAPAAFDATFIWPDPEIVFKYRDELITQVYVSTNGIDWERKQPPLRVVPTRLVPSPLGPIPDPRPIWYDNTLHTITSGRDYFLAAGEGLKISAPTFETDEWDVVSVGGRTILGSDFGEGQGRDRFVHVGVNGSISSHDPESISFPGISQNLNSVVWGKDQFVAVGDDSRILTSPTGQFWQVRSTEVLPAFRAIVSRPGQYVTVGESGLIYRSADAINWEPSASPTVLDLNDVIVSGPRFIAVGNAGAILTSGDGAAWTLRVSGLLENLNAITRSTNGTLIAVGDSGRLVRSSDESVGNWTQISTGVVDDLTAVAYNPVSNTFFVLGSNGRLLRSDDDGLTWTASVVPEIGTLPIYALHVNNDGSMVAAGELGRVFTSNDGAVWTRRFSGTTNAIHSLVFGDNLILATGAAGTALTSSDGGASWFRRHTNTGYTLFGSDFRDGAFVSVGGFSTIITSGAIESKFDQALQFVPIPPKIISDPAFPVFAQSTSGLPVEFSIVSGPATVVGNMVSLDGVVGEVVVRASQSGNANFRPATPIEQTFRVTLANQVITFAPLPDRTFGEPPFTLEASTNAPGLEVSFSVESGPAEIEGNLLTITGTGTITVVASQPGTDQFNAAPSISRSFVVNPASQSIVFNLPMNATLGDPPLVLDAEASSSLPVSFRVVSGPASLSGGQLVLDGVGPVVVEATQAGNELYLPAEPIQRTVQVAPAIPGNFWRPVTLPGAVAATDFRDVIWSGQDGRFVAVGSGQAVITSATGLTWNRRSSDGSADLTSVSRGFDGFLASSATGMRLRSPDGLSWAALSNALVAPVSDMAYGNGLFVAVGAGGFIATAPSGRQASDWTVRTSDAEGLLTSVIYSNGEFLAAGDGVLLRSHDGREWETVFNSPGDLFRDITRNGAHLVVVGETGVVWYSPDDGESWFLGVGASGNLTAVAYGAGRFVAIGEEGAVFTSSNGLEWTPRVSNVTANLRAIAFTERTFVVVGDNGTVLTTGDAQENVLPKDPQTITFNDLGNVPFTTDATVELLATAMPSGLPVRFGVSSGPAVLGADGVTLTLTGLGEVVVRASQPGDATFAPAPEVERRFTVTAGANVITFASLPDVTFGIDPFTLAASATSDLPVSFELVSGPAELDGDELTITGAGDVTVRAVQPGNALFEAAAPVEQSFTVNKAPQAISFDVPATVTLGDAPLELEATADSGLPVSFTLVSGPATLVNNVLTFTGSGSVVVEATQDGDDNWLAAPVASRTITVTAVAVGEFWRPLEVPSVADLRDVIYANGRFVAVGSDQTVLVSEDGLSWTRRSLGSVDLSAVAFGNNRFLSAGADGTRLVSSNGTNWSPLAGPLAEPVRSLTYGEGLFVAVSAGGSLLTSPDGVSWTPRAAETADDLNAVTYADGAFYAVGGGSVLRSEDGRTWSVALFSALDDLRGVTVRATDGRIVVVGANSTVWHSDDGSTWTLGDVIEADLNTVASGAGVFLAAGANGALYRSTNGQSWAAVSSGTAAGLNAIAFTENVFVIAGDGGVLLTSAEAGQEPETKALQTISFAALGDVSYDAGAVMLSATADSALPVRFGVSSGPAVLEADGVTLTLTGLGEVVVRASQSGDATFAPALEVERRFTVLAGANAISFAALADATFGDAPLTLTASATSGLPVSFELVSGPAELDGATLTLTGAGTVTVRAVQAGDAFFGAAAPVERSFTVNPAPQTISFDVPATVTLGVAPLELEATATSGLPVSLMLVSGPASLLGNVLTITGSGSVVVEATQAGDANWQAAPAVTRTITVTSVAVGEFWRELAVPGTADLRDVIYENGRFVAVGADQTVLVSEDGASWTRRSLGPVDLAAVAYGNNRYLAAGADGTRLVSSNGVNWSPLAGPLAEPVRSLAYGKGLFVAVSVNGGLLTSPDGVNWTARATETAADLNAVTYGGGSFYAVGGGSVLRSEDGRTWSVALFSALDDLRGVTVRATDGRIVVVGANSTVWHSDDGSTWTLGDVIEADLNTVASGAGVFLAAGANGALYRSTNGQSWAAVSSGTAAGLNAIAFTENVFVIAGDGGVLLTSAEAGQEPETKALQTISFAALADVSFDAGTVMLSATADSALPVRFGVSSGPAVLEADGVTLTLTGLGEVVVRASQSGDATFAPALEVERRFTVLAGANAISFAALADATFGDAPLTLTASATSGLPVSFELVSGPAELDGDELIITGAGDVTVRAVQPGDAFFSAAAPVERSFTVNPAPQTISFDVPATVTLGVAPLELEATATSGLPVSLMLVSGPASLLGNVLTITGSGSVVVEATQAGDANWQAAPAVTRTITVTSVAVGEFWRELAVPGTADLRDVIYENGRFVAVGADQTVLVSEDGASWTRRSLGPVDLAAVAYGNNRYLAAGADGTRLVSSNGVNWSPLAGPLAEPVRSLAYGKGLFVAVSVNGGLLTSPDGVNWTARATETAADLNAVTYGGGSFYAVGGGSVLRSEDGRTWSVALFSALDDLRGVTVRATDGRIVVVGANSTVWHSDDGSTWTLGDVIEADLNTVASGAGVFLAAGANGALYRSTNGQSWAAVSSGTAAGLNAIAFTENVFVIAGDGGVLLTSAEAGQEPETKALQTISFAALADVSFDAGTVMLSATADSALPVRFGVSSGPAVLEADGVTLTLTGLGEVVVRASQSGDATFAPAPEVERRFTVLAGANAISFAALADATFGDAPLTLTASATSGLPVSFELVSGPAELDGDELIITGAGDVTVRAVQPGDAFFSAAAPVERSFTVNPAPQTISFDVPATVTLGVAPLELEATAESGLPVSFTLVSGPATLVNNVLTFTGSGSVVVEATQDGDANWEAAAPVTRTITVTSVAVGDFWRPLEIPAAVADADFRDVIWSGLDGRFVAVGSGQAVITSSNGLSWALRSTGTPELTSVTQGFLGYLASSSTGIRLRSTSGLVWGPLSNALEAPISDMAYGKGLYVAVGANGYIATSPSGLLASQWTERSSSATGLLTSVIFSEDEFLAAGDGVILRSADGRVWETIFASPGDLFRGIARDGSNLVVVGEGGVVWSSPDAGDNWSLGIGAAGDFTAVAYGADRFVAIGLGGVIFTSSDGYAWTSQSSGVTANLRAIAFSERVFVVVGDNGTVLTTGDEQENVLPQTPQTITFPSLGDISLSVGSRLLSATADSGLPVRFGVSSGPAVLEADGVTLTFTGLGEVVVRASQSGDATFAPAREIERRFTVTGIAQTINFATIPPKVFGDPPFAPSATVLPSGLPASFEIVSGPAVIRDGLIEITGVGTVVVRATQAGDGTHMAAPPVEQSFQVERAPQVITFAVLSPMEVVDPPRTLVATASSGLPVSFEVVSGPATIADGNRLTPTGVGQVTVRATQAGNQLYLPAAPRERSFEVRPSSTGSVWTPLPDVPVETDLVGVSFAGIRFFATGARSAILRASSDATDWTAVSTGSGVLNKVAFGNNRYVAVGEAGIVLQSQSGTGWNFLSSGVDVPMNDIVYGNGRFVAVGSGGSIFTSTSGTDWTAVPSGVSDDLRSIVYGGGRFVAVGGRGITVSMDGVNWTSLETSEAAGFNAITYGGGRYLIVGDDFTVWSSSNTNSWTIGSQTGPDLFGVAYGAGRFIAVGADGAIFTSVSGMSGWLQRSSGTTANLRDIAYIEDKFVIVGDAGTILHDGVINIRAPQTISFGEIPDRGLMEGLLTLSATASSGLPVSLTVISGPATFMMDGRTLIFANGGVVSVRASQEGNSDFLPAPEVTRTFTVRGPSDPTDFALLSNRDLLLGELSGNDLEAAAVIIENTGRAAFIDSRMRSPDFLSVRRGLMVNAFMRGTWGGPQSMERNKEIIDAFGLAFLIESLIPEFRRVYFENRAVPGIMAPASEVDPFLRAVWRAKYGADAPDPTNAQLAPLREGFRSFPVEMFLAQVIQEVTGFDGRSVIFGIPNPPPNRLRDEADAAALIIGLMRLPASNAEVARLARQPLLAQIEQVLADERYFDRLALWAGSTEFSDDIRFSPWLGVHWVTGDGWTYSPELGWLYIFADDMMGLWIYSVDFGWMWTSPAYYSAGLYYLVNGGWSGR
jgi:photosystem II stability/assembly factor-like uncharacterized protein